MSVKIMGQVWDLDLPANKLLVLLAMTDHADHNGENIYPSIELVAWKTGYSESQARRVIKSLVKDGILSSQLRPGKTTLYSVHLEKGKLKQPFKRLSTGGQNDTPSIAMTPQGLHSYDTPTPSIAMTPEPSVKPSNNRMPLLDPMADAISHVWKTKASGLVNNIRAMMLGISKSGEWSGSNFNPPANPAEVLSFGKWWKQKHPDLTIPNKPEKIQRWFYEYRDIAAKKITPLDPALDLSIPVEFEMPSLQYLPKAVGDE